MVFLNFFPYVLLKISFSGLQLSRLLPRLLREAKRGSVHWSKKLDAARSLALYSDTTAPRIAVITLERTPLRSARLVEELHRDGAAFEHFYAVDGAQEFDKHDLLKYAGTGKQKKLRAVTSLHLPVLNAGQVLHERLRFGCYMSHVRLWERQVDLSTPHQVVLEDDALPCENFQYALQRTLLSLPSEWDILYLGSCYTKLGGLLRARIRQVRGALCTYGYVISLSGAVKLVSQQALKSDKPVDHMLDEAIYRSVISAYHADPPLIYRYQTDSTLAYPDKS